jgi:hypothetical protein
VGLASGDKTRGDGERWLTGFEASAGSSELYAVDTIHADVKRTRTTTFEFIIGSICRVLQGGDQPLVDVLGYEGASKREDWREVSTSGRHVYVIIRDRYVAADKCDQLSSYLPGA